MRFKDTKILAIGFFMFIFFNMNAQNIGVNSTGSIPDVSAGFDVDFTNKGLLIPRIALTGVNDAVTIATPATSLLIYNTNAALPDGVGYYYNSGTTAAPVWLRLTTGAPSNDWTILGNAGTNPATNFLGTTDAQDFLIKTNNIDKIRIMSNAAGTHRVGIGTNFPTSYPVGNTPTLFHVYDGEVTATNYGLIQIGSNKTTATNKVGELNFHSAVAATDRRTASIESYVTAVSGIPNVSGDLRFFTNNQATATFTEKMRIEAGGRVGIGITNPDGQLDVTQETSSPVALFTNYGNVHNTYFRRAQGTLAAPTIIGISGVLGRLIGQGYDGASFQSATQIAFEVDATSGAGDMPGRITFSTTPDGSTTLTERMRITNSGNVLIGTTTPVTNAILSIKDGHIQTSQTTAPTIAVTANAGTAGAAALTATSNDIVGRVTLTTGTAAWASGVQCIVTFNRPYTTAPLVLLTPADIVAASSYGLNIFVTSTTTTFSITFGNAAAQNMNHRWNYLVIEP